jgi:hypothetical protein
MKSTISADGSRAQKAGSDRAHPRRSVFAPVISNGFEWVNFLICCYFARAVSRGFVPNHGTPFSGMTAAATLTVGLIVKELRGGTIEASLECIGRARALAILVVMTAGALLVALTPGFNVIDVAAPGLLVVAKVLEGLPPGAE